MDDILLIKDNYGNRFYEITTNNGQLGGYDYARRRILSGEEASRVVFIMGTERSEEA